MIIDLYGARRLEDMKHIERTLRRCVEVAGATLLQVHLHPTSAKGGSSGVAVLAESHISVHTWPEADYAAFDVFMSGDADPEAIVPVLKAAFSARTVGLTTHLRGKEMPAKAWVAGGRKAPARLKKAA